MTKNTKDSVQACSVLHVAHVGVRRVTVVIVHIGHEEVVVVIYFCVAIFGRDLLMSNLWKASLQQVTQSGMTTVLGLLMSGKLKLRRTNDRRDLIKLFGR